MKKYVELLITLSIIITVMFILWTAPILIHNLMDKIYWPNSPLSFLRNLVIRLELEDH